jgi:hypothetical protein
VSSLRYLLPVLALAAVAVALVTLRRDRWASAATGLLVLAIAYNLRRWLKADDPEVVPVALTAAGIAAGALLAPALARVPAAGLRLMPAAGCAALAVALCLATPGFVGRVAARTAYHESPMLRWLSARPEFERGGRLAVYPIALGVLAGDRLQNRVVLLPERVSCDVVLARRATTVMVIGDRARISEPSAALKVGTARGCLQHERPAFDDGNYRVYLPAGAR